MAWFKKFTPKSETEKKAEMDELTTKLEEGIKNVFDSQNFKDYLKMCSKLHNYSANNVLLVLLQKPDASMLAGYNAWKNDFKRHVKKGEKGLKILAPVTVKRKVEESVTDQNGRPVFNTDGTRKTETVTKEFITFRPASVFDVSQTEGEDLPSIAPHELQGEVDGFEKFFEAVKKISPVPVEFGDTGEAKGYFSPSEQKIVIKPGMSDVQTAKTALHEAAHALLGHGDPACKKDRDTRECEAEGCAYVVSQHFGIDTGEYSFAYVAGWSSGKSTDDLKETLSAIQKTATSIIEKLEEEMSREVSLRDQIEHYVQASGYGKYFEDGDYAAVESALKDLKDHEPNDLGRAISLRMWSECVRRMPAVNKEIIELFSADPYAETWCRHGDLLMQKCDGGQGVEGVDFCLFWKDGSEEYAGFYDGQTITLSGKALSSDEIDLSGFVGEDVRTLESVVSEMNLSVTTSLFLKHYGDDEEMERKHPELYDPEDLSAYEALNAKLEEDLGLNLYGFYNITGDDGANALDSKTAEILHSYQAGGGLPEKAAAVFEELDGGEKEYFEAALKEIEKDLDRNRAVESRRSSRRSA